MIKKMCFSVMASVLLATPALGQETTPTPYNCDYSPSCEVAPGVYGAMGSPVRSKFDLSIGGYIKLDYAHNSNASGPISQTGGTQVGSKEESIFTAKQSRFWLKVAGPSFLGAKTNALIEADFYGAGSQSNELSNLRMRHAYGSLDWTDTQLLFGQFWDTFGPAAADTIDFRQGGETGAPNNPRVPQIRLTQKVNIDGDNAVKFVLSVQNPTQDNATGSGVNAGTGSNATNTVSGAAAPLNSPYGDMVNVAGQVMFSSKALGVTPGFMGLGMNPLQVGVFGLYGNEKITGNKKVDDYGYGLYGFVPLVSSRDGRNRAMTLSLEAQVAYAAGLNVQNATSLQYVGSAPNRRAATGYDLYAQLKFYPVQHLGITGGYMRRGAIDFADYRATTTAATTFQKYNANSYANLTYDLNAAIRVATEYEHDITQYDKSLGAGSYGQNNIFRVAAYYFF